jgi:hypothetical protein
MAPLLWLSIMIVGFPIVFYLPAHLVFSKVFPPPVAAVRTLDEPSQQSLDSSSN